MEALLLAAKVVMPLFVYMTIGGWIRKVSIFSLENFKAQNRLVFRVFLPLTLFVNIYEADLGKTIRPGIFVFAFVCILLEFVASWILFTHTIRDRADASTMIQGVYRSNFVLFGNVVAGSLCGEEGLALVAALSALVVPLVNILAVILFEVKRANNLHIPELIISIFKNPLVDAGLLGCVFKLFRIPFPGFLYEPLATLGDIATPLALVTLGGILSFGSMVKHRKYLAVAAAGRLVVIPLLALAAAVAAGYRGDALVAVLAIFASPTAVASTPMAQSMGGNGELAGEIVAVTSVCCIVTMFLFVFFLSQAGFI